MARAAKARGGGLVIDLRIGFVAGAAAAGILPVTFVGATQPTPCRYLVGLAGLAVGTKVAALSGRDYSLVIGAIA